MLFSSNVRRARGTAPSPRLRQATRAYCSGVLAAVTIAAVLPIGAAAAASASSTVNSGGAPQLGGFSARALGPDGNVTPKTYFALALAPGESFDGEILVSNAAKTFVRLRVDSVDGLTGQTSGTVYANRTDPRRETSQWITPSKRALRMDARSARALGFHVQVPRNARPGDHVGAVAFQRIVPAKQGNFAVRQVLRVAVAVQIRVAGDAAAALVLGRLSLQALGGTQIPSVGVALRNTGQLLCRPALTVTLAKDGESLGTVNKQLDTVLAGDAIDFPLPWPRPLESGSYEATAATSGCGTPAQTRATVKLSGSLRGSSRAPGPDTAALADDEDGLPWWALAGAFAGALGLGFLLARRFGRRKDETEPPAAPPGSPVAAVATVPSDDDDATTERP
jgi:hypothetical protein